jgi:hypothetical protein
MEEGGLAALYFPFNHFFGVREQPLRFPAQGETFFDEGGDTPLFRQFLLYLRTGRVNNGAAF